MTDRSHHVGGARLLIALAALALAPPQAPAGHGKVVVANRASGTISVIDTGTDTVAATIPLPREDDEPTPEPMYVVYTPAGDLVWVDDRANDRVVAFDAESFEVVSTLPVGDGAFHMAADAFGLDLVVVNDLDRTLTVIDAWRGQVVGTADLPEDLLEAGAVPHDVILDPFGLFAYVTFVNVPGEFDVVVQFETWSFSEVNRARVGNDPHVSFNWRNWEVYLPCQGSDVVIVLDAWDLDEVAVIDIPGAHGAITSLDARRFYTTNLPGLGEDAVIAIDTHRNRVKGVADAPHTVPHNLALTPDADKLYVTHSGPNSTVSVYDVGRGGAPAFLGSVTVGNNPFGIAFVP